MGQLRDLTNSVNGESFIGQVHILGTHVLLNPLHDPMTDRQTIPIL